MCALERGRRVHTCDDVHGYILCAHTEDDDGDRIGRGVGATKFQNNSIEGLGFYICT